MKKLRCGSAGSVSFTMTTATAMSCSRGKAAASWLSPYSSKTAAKSAFSLCIRNLNFFVSTSLLQIYGASTALLRKNKCSTYSKYVSALFLLAPCICTVSLQKLTEVFFESVLLKIYGASSALSHRQNYTSVYSFDCEFRAHAKHRFWLIRAASMPLLKMLNVAERTRMSVVPRES